MHFIPLHLGSGEPFNDVLVYVIPTIFHEVNAIAVKTPRDVSGQWVFGQDLGNVTHNNCRFGSDATCHKRQSSPIYYSHFSIR